MKIIMKRLFFLVTIFCTLISNAQNYLITFAGTGASASVEIVIAENLMTGTIDSVNGNESLTLTETTSIISSEDSQFSTFNIYPNPMAGRAVLRVNPPIGGEASITVYDMAGKQLFRLNKYLENSLQEFLISGFDNGLYLINVAGKNYFITGKIVSTGNNSGSVRIDQISSNLPDIEKASFETNKGRKSISGLPYSPGDRLKFTGISGIYKTVVTAILTADTTITFTFIPCTDSDGNNYPVLQVGTQTWMGENLAYLPSVSPSAQGSYTNQVDKDPYYYVYDYEGTNISEARATSSFKTYGVLYNWSAALTSCPTGWHLPSDEEWKVLEMNLGMSREEADKTGWRGTDEGGKLKESGTVHWQSPNVFANDESGFTAMPGGYRNSQGYFNLKGSYGYWWSGTEYDALKAWDRLLYYGAGTVYRYNFHSKGDGFSIRCLKD
jgi:uncharacterized protein (TIGR02145 family)